jgi:dTDP-4-dehydrorhamnose 3,5-epimerase
MRITHTALSGVTLIEPKVYGDHRGFFYESWNSDVFARNGLPSIFVQDNHSRSAQGILRGLHYQLNRPQGKLVRVVSGAVFDVAVDLRRSSKTFGHSFGIELSAENHRMLWVPPGCAHGFLVMSASADFAYKCTDFYFPEDEFTLRWDDPALGILWPINPHSKPILSSKDEGGMLLADLPTFA